MFTLELADDVPSTPRLTDYFDYAERKTRRVASTSTGRTNWRATSNGTSWYDYAERSGPSRRVA